MGGQPLVSMMIIKNKNIFIIPKTSLLWDFGLAKFERTGGISQFYSGVVTTKTAPNYKT